MRKGTWLHLEGTFWSRQQQLSKEVCACGCKEFLTNRTAKNKAKGLTDGYVNGHQYKAHKEITDKTRKKMIASQIKRNMKGSRNPNYGNGFKVSGEKNPNWQGGKTLRYKKGNHPGINTLEDVRFRKFIKEIDKKCILCGNTTRLEMHHIESWIDFKELKFEKTNCVTLCKSCHVRIDNKHHKAQYKEMLSLYAKNRIIQRPRVNKSILMSV